VWAERGGRPTPWHPRHIVERYGLFTIIVLGECMLATSAALQAAVVTGGVTGDLLLIAAGGLLLVFGLWWSYFKHAASIGQGEGAIAPFLWGYGHYVIFAAVAAMGAGLAVAVDTTLEALPLSAAMTALTVAVPVVAFLAAAGVLHARPATIRVWTPFAVFAPIVLVAALSAAWIGVPLAILAMGLLLSIYVAYNVAAMHRAALEAGGLPSTGDPEAS
jgi:low temperature requirement protein LtrA